MVSPWSELFETVSNKWSIFLPPQPVELSRIFGCGSSMYLPSIAGGPLALSFGGNWIAMDSGSDVQESHLTFPSALRISHLCLSRA